MLELEQELTAKIADTLESLIALPATAVPAERVLHEYIGVFQSVANRVLAVPDGYSAEEIAKVWNESPLVGPCVHTPARVKIVALPSPLPEETPG